MSFGFSSAPGGVQEYGFRFDPRLSRQAVRLEYAGLTGETFFPAFNRDGWLWGVNGISGWWESAPVATRTVDAPRGDGVLVFARRFGARPISLSGFVVAQSRRADGVLEEALDRLAASHSGTLVVDELRRGVSREADVRLTDMQVTRLNDYSATVTLSFQHIKERPRHRVTRIQKHIPARLQHVLTHPIPKRIISLQRQSHSRGRTPQARHPHIRQTNIRLT